MTDRGPVMDDRVRQTLAAIVEREGERVAHDGALCEALLRDYAPQAKREVYLLTTACRAGVPDRLLRSSQAGMSLSQRAAQLAAELRDDYAIDEGAAQWAVQSWAGALKLAPQAAAEGTPPQPPPPAAAAAERPGAGGLWHWYVAALRKYVTFSGRARRREFWYFSLVNFLITLVLTFADMIITRTFFDIDYPPLVDLYAVGVFLPGLAVAVRRLHDVGRSGWWLAPVVGAYFIIGFLQESSYEPGNEWLGLAHGGSLILTVAFFIRNSQAGVNRFGPNPKEAP